MKRKRTVLRALGIAIAFASFGLTGCNDDSSNPTTPSSPEMPTTPPPANPGLLRVAQLTVDARTVDVVIDGVMVASNVAYANVTRYVELSEDEHRVQIFPRGDRGVALVETSIFVASDSAHTIAVVGNDPINLVVAEDTSVVGAGSAMVRLFNAVPDFPATLDLAVVNGPLVVASVPYPRASAYTEVVPGAYAFVLKRGGTEEQIASAFDQLPASTTTTVFAVGSLGRGDIALVTARDID